MVEDKEEKYWIWILAFTAFVFAVYPMIKDYSENSDKTILNMLSTLLFSFVFMVVAQFIYNKFIKHSP